MVYVQAERVNMNQLISFWLNEAARAAWLWSQWLDSAAEAWSE